MNGTNAAGVGNEWTELQFSILNVELDAAGGG